MVLRGICSLDLKSLESRKFWR